MDTGFVLDVIGECVPAAVTDKSGNVVDVFCQDCVKPMTQEEHKEYFNKYIPWFEKKFKKISKHRARPNYDE